MRFTQRAHARIRVAAVTAGIMALAMFTAPPAAAADAPELVVNGAFTQGVTGWKSNDQTRRPLSSTTQGRVGLGAAITPASAGVVTLNDVIDTVRSTKSGETYTMRAWVKSPTAGVRALIKAREVSGATATSHQAEVKLTDTGWRELTLTFKTSRAGAKLDLNVLFLGVSAGKAVLVDDVSLKSTQSAGAAAPSPTPTPSPTSAPSPNPGTCTRPLPSGTAFGSSLSTSGQSAAQSLAGVDAIFGKIPVARVFDPGMLMSWDKPRTQMLAGRDLVISFRPLPQDILAGKYDAELRAWFAQAPSDISIYWSYIHEPEPMIDKGTFTADQYRRAWQRIDSIADSVCRSNTYATLILTGWTTMSASKRDWRIYYAGADVIDVMAFDPYNGASNPAGVTSYPSAASIFDSVVRVAAEAGKPYGIAETGSPKIPSDVSGSGRAAWLSDVAAFNRTHGALFVTYFHSSNDGEWRLLDGPSQQAWRTAVASSR